MIVFSSHSIAPALSKTCFRSLTISSSVPPFSQPSLWSWAAFYPSTWVCALVTRHRREPICAWLAASPGSPSSTCGSAGPPSTRPNCTLTCSSRQKSKQRPNESRWLTKDRNDILGVATVITATSYRKRIRNHVAIINASIKELLTAFIFPNHKTLISFKH